MSYRWVILWPSIAGMAGCAHARAPGLDPCAPRPGEVYGSTADSLRGGVPVSAAPRSVYLERDLEPDEAMRTYDHLWGLRYDLRRFRAASARLPETIEQFSDPHRPGIKQNFDAWGSSIRYTRTSEAEYELRAPGPDHTLCTADDMIVRNDTFINAPAAAPLP